MQDHLIKPILEEKEKKLGFNLDGTIPPITNQALMSKKDGCSKASGPVAPKTHVSDALQSNHHIDELYEFCLKQGAFGGKLCGAGGGGFLLMIVPPECRARFEDAVGPSRCMPFRVDVQGTVILQKSHAA